MGTALKRSGECSFIWKSDGGAKLQSGSLNGQCQSIVKSLSDRQPTLYDVSTKDLDWVATTSFGFTDDQLSSRFL